MNDSAEHHFSAAEGYFQLGMFEEAHAELEFADNFPGHRMGFIVRKLELYILEARWEDAAPIAEALCDLEPDEPDHFMNYACSLSCLGYPHRAIHVLLDGPAALREIPTFHYSLGCYHVLVGDDLEALGHIERAAALDERLLPIAHMDPTLKCIRDLLPPVPDRPTEPGAAAPSGAAAQAPWRSRHCDRRQPF